MYFNSGILLIFNRFLILIILTVNLESHLHIKQVLNGCQFKNIQQKIIVTCPKRFQGVKARNFDIQFHINDSPVQLIFEIYLKRRNELYRRMGDKICMVKYHRQRYYFARVRLRKYMTVFLIFLRITLNQISLFSNPISLSLHKHFFVPNPTIFPTGASGQKFGISLGYLQSIHTSCWIISPSFKMAYLSFTFIFPDLTYHIIPSFTGASFLCPSRFIIIHWQTSKENFLLPHSDTNITGVSTPAILHFSEHQLGVL